MAADYIIIGGGTSGLLIANRLSVDPQTHVVVIEPGDDDRSNPNVTDPLKRNKNANSPIDWSYKSTPQSRLNDRNLEFTAGKIVGGTSMINGMMYIRTAVPEIDGWEEHMGITGWNWDALWPFYKDLERFIDPTPEQEEAGAGVVPEYHGRSGDVVVSYPNQLLQGDLSHTLAATWKTLGVSVRKDANGGIVQGYTVRPMMVDKESGARASAATAFYYPVSERSNLSLIQGTALNLTWNQDAESEKQVANGVRYLDADGNVQNVLLNDSGEVVVAAGALVTPGILEASGIGSSSRLRKLGIEVKIDLPGVGENLQDQPDLTLSYHPKTATPSAFTPYAAFVTAKDVFGDKSEEIAAATEANIPSWAETIAKAGNPVGVDAIETILRHQHDLMFKKNIAIGEITMTSSDKIASEYWGLLPFSRGSVHIACKNDDGTWKRDIDPKFFLIDYDLETMIALSRLTQRFWATEPAAEQVLGRIDPTNAQVPMDATDLQWKSYIKSTAVPNHHMLGTAAMMSRELGGVVDEELKVYDTENVRVVDASVIPLQVTGHFVSTIYAVAGRAAELIQVAAARDVA